MIGEGECITKRDPENVEENLASFIMAEIPRAKIFNGKVMFISMQSREIITIGMTKKLINGIMKILAKILLRVSWLKTNTEKIEVERVATTVVAIIFVSVLK